MKLNKLIVTGLSILALSASACGKKEEKTAGEPAPAAEQAMPKADEAAAPKADEMAPKADEAAAPKADEAMPAAGADDDGSAAGVTAEEKAIADKTIVMLQGLVKAAETHKDNCDAMAGEMQTIVDSNKGLMEQGRALDKDPAKKAWFDKTYGPKAMEIMGGMMGNMQNCMQHEGVKKVFENMAAQ